MIGVDSTGLAQRLRALLPQGWFGDVVPLRDAVVGGLSDALAWSYSQLMAVAATTRRSTMTGWLLDLDAFDFLGRTILRRTGESDDKFRARYLAEVIRPRGRRQDIAQALTDLTGRKPVIIEPWNPGDCGAYDIGTFAYSGTAVSPGPQGAYDSAYAGWDAGTWGFDLKPVQTLAGSSGAGCWGSMILPAQMFITAYRTQPTGTPNIAGYDVAVAGWDIPTTGWVGSDLNEVTAPDAEIYSTINRNKAAGVIAWTKIQS